MVLWYVELAISKKRLNRVKTWKEMTRIQRVNGKLTRSERDHLADLAVARVASILDPSISNRGLIGGQNPTPTEVWEMLPPPSR
jgi:hypothetical protein